jgi:DNA-binding PadR family transcriptional regulator
MREASYLILAALQHEPRHGYAIMRFAAESSGGRVSLSTGTLYTALDRLSTAGLIVMDRQEVVDGRARRYYRLTDTGTAALLAEAERLAAMARLVAPDMPGGTSASRQARVRPA